MGSRKNLLVVIVVAGIFFGAGFITSTILNRQTIIKYESQIRGLEFLVRSGEQREKMLLDSYWDERQKRYAFFEKLFQKEKIKDWEIIKMELEAFLIKESQKEGGGLQK